MRAIAPAVTCGMLFLSGASAVAFESLWFHQASLTFGNSVWAATLVLCGLMGGLALGNALVGRFGHRVRRPVRVYAVLELVIAATGFALVAILPALASVLAPVFRPLLDQPWLLNPLRLTLALLLLLVPTTAMGATLPFLVGALTASDPRFGSVLGRLYGWNTLGAVVGALVTQSVLVGPFGIRGAGLCAAALNLAAAALAGLLARADAAVLPEAPPAAPLSRTAKRILAAGFVCGATLLALEVVWFRFLLLFVVNTSHALALLLSVVLLGIGLGGLIGSAWTRRNPNAHAWAPLVMCGSGILVVSLYQVLSFDQVGAPGTTDAVGIALLGIKLMLPVACLSGVLFALLGEAAYAEVRDATRAASLLTLGNTTGSLVGAIAGGVLLLPYVGMEGSFFLLALAYAVGAALTLRAPVRRATAAAGLIFAVRLALFPFGLMAGHFLPLPARIYTGDGSTIIAVKEGITETILFLGRDWLGGPVFRRLLTNGVSMSGTDTLAKRYMKLFVYWPVAVHPGPKRALLISYGVGSTAKALTDTASLAHIDVVDISRDVMDMAPLVYPDPKTAPLNDPRVQVIVEDGRYFLLTTDRRYDLITAEPPPPKNAGIVNLYTQEYFELLRDRLADGGVATYWLPVHQLVASDTKAITAAFCSAFPDCSLWNGAGLDWMLVGTRNTPAPTAEHLARPWADPVVGPELRALGLEGPEQLGALFLADAAWLADFTRDTLPLNDDHPKRLSPVAMGSEAGDAHAFHAGLMAAKDARERFQASPWVRAFWPAPLVARTVPAFHVQHVINQWLLGDRLGHPTVREFANLHAVLTRTPYQTAAIWLLGSTADAQRLAHQAHADPRTDALVAYHRAVGAIAARDFATAIDLLAPATDVRSAHAAAYALTRAGRAPEARALRDRFPGDEPAFWTWLDRIAAEPPTSGETPGGPR